MHIVMIMIRLTVRDVTATDKHGRNDVFEYSTGEAVGCLIMNCERD